jgi:hypothetical protein
VSVVDADRVPGRGRWFFALPLLPFGGVLLALAAGASRARWLPVAGFLAVTATGDVYFWVGARLQLRRAWRQRQVELPWGIQHRAPLWMPLMRVLAALATGAVIAAVPAAVGFPRVGLGVLSIFAIVAAGAPFAELGPRALTFEADGLRFHVRGGSFVVPWTAIDRVERIGPDHAQLIRLHVADATRIIDSFEPKDPRILPRVESCIAKSSGGGGRLLLMPWTAGLDGPSIARTIEAAIRNKASAFTAIENKAAQLN